MATNVGKISLIQKGKYGYFLEIPLPEVVLFGNESVNVEKLREKGKKNRVVLSVAVGDPMQ